MRELLANLHFAGVLGVPGVPCLKTEVCTGTPGVLVGVPGVPEHLAEHPEHLAEHLPSPNKYMKRLEEHPEHQEHRKKGVPRSAALKSWPLLISRIDPSRAPARYDPDRWRCLIDDARWLCRCHGEAAHGLGWSASDLFGVGAAPGWGGLADRLVGARKLLLTDRIAHWRGDEVEGWLWRQTMRPMPLIWDRAPH
jgi:hypothetical protein